MNCEQTRDNLSAHLDNELKPSEAAALQAHLAGCQACATELDALKRASRMVRDLPLRTLPAGFLTRLNARRQDSPAAAAPGALAWLGPRPLAFVAAALVAGLVIVGPWRSQRLARAPGGPIASSVPPPAAREAPLDLPALTAKDAVPPPAAAPTAPRIAGADDAKAAVEARAKADAFTAEQYGKLEDAKKAAPMAAVRGAGRPYGSPQPYSNEQLHDLLDKEAKSEGIQGSAKELEADEDKPDTSFMGPHLGVPGSRERSQDSIRQLQALRKQVEANAGKAAQVPIAGTMAPILGTGGGGASGPGQALDAGGPPLQEGFWSGDYAAGNAGTRTIEDDDAWAGLWRTLSTQPPPPVDFKRSMVVAVFLGPRPSGGYAVEFAETKRLAHSLLVRWRERAPEAGQSAPDGATSPYALKLLPKSDVPVRFEKTR